MTETLPKRTRQMMLAANVFTVIVVVADLFYLTNMIQVDLPSFTLLNLVVLGLGLWSFRVKRSIKARMAHPGDESPEQPKEE